MGTKKIKLPEGWEFDKVEDGDIILKESEKKVSELPKSWEEYLMSIPNKDVIKYMAGTDGYMDAVFALRKLLFLRDVYRRGWEPDWKGNSPKFGIYYAKGNVQSGELRYTSAPLTFQNELTRNVFLENFKDLIERAKELL